MSHRVVMYGVWAGALQAQYASLVHMHGSNMHPFCICMEPIEKPCTPKPEGKPQLLPCLAAFYRMLQASHISSLDGRIGTFNW